MKRDKINTYLSFLSKLAVTALFFILIIDKVDIGSTIKILKAVDLSLFLFSLLIMIFEVLIANIRWLLVLKQLGLTIFFSKALRYLWIGVFFNQALPSSIGGDAVRGYYLYKIEKFTLGDASLGVLLDRLIGLFGLVLLVILTLPLIFNSFFSSTSKWTILIIIFGALSAISMSLIIDLIPKKLTKSKVMTKLSIFSLRGREVLLSYNGFLSLIISIIIHLTFVFAAWFLAIAIGINISLGQMLLIVPITNLLIALPISIAGWGIREGLFIAGLGYLNIASDAALALSILYGLLMLTVSLPGLIQWFLQNSKTTKQLK